MKTARILILMTTLALAGAPAFGQSGMPGPPPDDRQREEGQFDPGGPPSGERREEVRKKIEAIRLWRLTEELKLDAATSGKLSAVLAPLDLKRREIQRGQMESMRSLRLLLRSEKPDDAQIKPLLDRIESNHRAMQELRSAEWKGLKDILTVEQQARYLVFQQEFEREMRGMIAGAREGAGRGPGMRGGGGPGRGGMGQGPRSQDRQY